MKDPFELQQVFYACNEHKCRCRQQARQLTSLILVEQTRLMAMTQSYVRMNMTLKVPNSTRYCLPQL